MEYSAAVLGYNLYITKKGSGEKQVKKGIITVLLTVIIISAMWITSAGFSKEQVFDVTVIEPQEKTVSDYVNANGRVLEGNRKDIYTKSVSEVKRIMVEEGQTVKKGDVLFELSQIDFDFEEYFDSLPDTSKIEEIFLGYGISFSIDDMKKARESIMYAQNTVTSPINGIITEINIDVGDNVTPIQKLASVSDFSDLYISALVPEAYALKVFKGADVEIGGDAFGNTKYMGKITKVLPKTVYVPSLTGEGKTYTKVLVELNAQNKAFRPGLNVNTRITVNTSEKALTIPYECVFQDEENAEYVFLLKNNIVKRQVIKTGYELDEVVEVKSGINKNSKVISDAPEGLFDGAAVNTVKME